MPRKKEIKSEFHLKFIPPDRLPDLIALANAFPNIKDKHIALCKYIETFSSIVERCWNKNKRFVGVSEKYLKQKLGLDNKGTARILRDLIQHKFIIRDTTNFIKREVAWEYKPVF